MEPGQMHVLDYLAVVRRRRWWLVAPIALSVVVGILLARFLPKEYRSSVTLGVAAPIVSPNLVSQSTSLNTDDRLRAISQQLLSLPILDRVVKDEAQKGGSDDLQIGDLQRTIEITVPETVTGANGSGQKRLDNFVVSYSDEDPVRAQRVANRLATVFVDENSKSRTERAEDTSAFIATQLRTSQARLADLEARLRQSKEAHMGQLPEQTQANLQMLAGLRQQLEANATTLRGEQDRLTMIERQIEAYKLDNAVAAGPKGTDAGTPEARIVALQQELAVARSSYTAKHPEVMRLESELAAARRDLEAERDKPQNEQAARDPAYRQLLQDRDATRLRVDEIQRSGNDTQRQIALYQSRVEAAPMVEQQLATVQRDFDLEKQQYSDLSAKLHSATIAESVERNRSGEQFTILYPASFPLTPTKPVIWRVMLMAIAAGLAAGATLAFLREYLDRSVHDARALKNEFNHPILGEIAHINA